MDSKKCTRCKVSQEKDQFISIRGAETKMCARCRDVCNKSAKNTRCEHGKKKTVCKECDGGGRCSHGLIRSHCRQCGSGKSFCEHDRIRSHCVRCEGGSVCVHKKLKTTCKKCNGGGICSHGTRRNRCKECSKDPLKLAVDTMIWGSKRNDKKYGRYDADNFIDRCFLKGLFEEQTVDGNVRCYHCQGSMQVMEWYEETMCTIERLDNAIGHIKSNCVLACTTCNKKHKGKH